MWEKFLRNSEIHLTKEENQTKNTVVTETGQLTFIWI